MNRLKLIDNILHSDFKAETTILEEPSVSMSVEVDKRGCNSIIYKFDKELSKDYRGGLFPFFQKNKGVCKICDYIILAEKNSEITALVVEMKRGKQQTFPQLNAAECFVDYIINTVNRVNELNLKIKVRKISIHEFRIRKRSTKPKDIVFDKLNHCVFRNNKFFVASFLD